MQPGLDRIWSVLLSGFRRQRSFLSHRLFSFLVLVPRFSFRCSRDDLSGCEVVPHACYSYFDLVAGVGSWDEYYEVVETGDSVASPTNRIDRNIDFLALLHGY